MFSLVHSAAVGIGFYGNSETNDGVYQLIYAINNANHTLSGIDTLVRACWRSAAQVHCGVFRPHPKHLPLAVLPGKRWSWWVSRCGLGRAQDCPLWGEMLLPSSLAWVAGGRYVGLRQDARHESLM